MHCAGCFTRRSLIALAGGGALGLLAGCEDPPIDLVSDETVEALGLEAWGQILQDTGPAADPMLQERLESVARRLIIAAGELPRDWEVVAFAGPEINAFALPGRKIGVFEGLFRVANTPDQLAAVIGHEIGHLAADHSQERLNAQVAKGWGLRAVAFLLQQGDVAFAAEIAAALGVGVEYGLVLPYSRRQELEADRLGLVAMNDAGFDPREAVTLWQRMEAAASSSLPAFLATHPAPSARIEAIEQMLLDLGAR